LDLAEQSIGFFDLEFCLDDGFSMVPKGDVVSSVYEVGEVPFCCYYGLASISQEWRPCMSLGLFAAVLCLKEDFGDVGINLVQYAGIIVRASLCAVAYVDQCCNALHYIFRCKALLDGVHVCFGCFDVS
jgi:hypothetical protein